MQRLAWHFIVLVAASLVPLGVHAQLFRAYLASYGSDTNPCTVAAPCRLLPAAVNAVHDGGEIWMLDSANFNGGTVNVTKSVKIQAIPGQVGSIAPVAGLPAMTIAPGLTVALRNISMVTNANSPGTDGIQMTTGSLSVEDSVFEANAATEASAIFVNGAGTVSIHNSIFRNGSFGVWVRSGGSADVSASKFVGFTTAGIYVSSGVAGTNSAANVRDSYFSASYAGVWADGDVANASSRATVVGCSMSKMFSGVIAQVLQAGSASVASVANTTVTGTTYAFYNFEAVIETQGNNSVRGNTNVNAGSLTTVGGI